MVGILHLGVCPADPITRIDVPAGDSAALLAAVAAGPSTEISLIRLGLGAEYRLDLSATPPAQISGRVIIRGRGAHIVGEGAQSFGSLFVVQGSGVLELTDLTVREFDGAAVRVDNGRFGLIQNHGTLIGRNLRFEAIRARSDQSILGGVIANGGELDLDGVRVVDVSTSDGGGGAVVLFNTGRALVQNLLIVDAFGEDAHPPGRGGTQIWNLGTGDLEIRFSSFISESEPFGVPSAVHAIFASGGLGIQPRTSMAASMVIGMPSPCGVRSLGFNLFTDDLCHGPDDLVGVSPGELAFRRSDDHGLEVVLPRGSPALDAVVDPAFDCPGTDAIGSPRPRDGDGDGRARCDIGAFEAAGEAQLFRGGANGLFYSARMDGHYVTIQEARPDEYVVFWNTFDLAGKQAWILAQGFRDGDEITADAYFLPEGVLVPGGGANVDTDGLQRWGRVVVRLFDCATGEFSYESALPEFGAGSFPLDRLGLVAGLGCRDQSTGGTD